MISQCSKDDQVGHFLNRIGLRISEHVPVNMYLVPFSDIYLLKP